MKTTFEISFEEYLKKLETEKRYLDWRVVTRIELADRCSGIKDSTVTSVMYDDNGGHVRFIIVADEVPNLSTSIIHEIEKAFEKQEAFIEWMKTSPRVEDRLNALRKSF
jgi:hypothetical protein